MNLLWLNDGKAGHRRQAEGLLASLRRCGATLQVHEVVVPRGLRDWWRIQSDLPKGFDPELLLGVGHRTHALLLLLKRQYPKAQSLLLMRPSLPLDWFDLLIMPQHDAPPLSPESLPRKAHSVLLLINSVIKLVGI